MLVASRRGARRPKSIDIDEVDHAILLALQAEGRLTFSALGRRLKLSQPAISQRVTRLQAEGAILGYRAIVDPDALGLPVSAVLMISTPQARSAACLKRLQSMPEAVEVTRVMGDVSIICRVVLPATDALEGVVTALSRYGSVTTLLVLGDEPVKTIDFEAADGRER